MSVNRGAVAAALAVLVACGTAGDAPLPNDAAPRDTAAPAAGTAPYRIESPAPGVVWREGEAHVIRWTRNRPGPVNVSAAVGGKDKGHLSFALPRGTDSLEWRIPVGFVTGFGPERSDAVRIRVESSDDSRIGVESAPFTIAAASAATSASPP